MENEINFLHLGDVNAKNGWVRVEPGALASGSLLKFLISCLCMVGTCANYMWSFNQVFLLYLDSDVGKGELEFTK